MIQFPRTDLQQTSNSTNDEHWLAECVTPARPGRPIRLKMINRPTVYLMWPLLRQHAERIHVPACTVYDIYCLMFTQLLYISFSACSDFQDFLGLLWLPISWIYVLYLWFNLLEIYLWFSLQWADLYCNACLLLYQGVRALVGKSGLYSCGVNVTCTWCVRIVSVTKWNSVSKTSGLGATLTRHEIHK